MSKDGVPQAGKRGSSIIQRISGAFKSTEAKVEPDVALPPSTDIITVEVRGTWKHKSTPTMGIVGKLDGAIANLVQPPVPVTHSEQAAALLLSKQKDDEKKSKADAERSYNFKPTASKP
jgi:hypothetical protein